MDNATKQRGRAVSAFVLKQKLLQGPREIVAKPHCGFEV
ncbi:hypothetical protein BRUCa_2144 [Brucella melitensis]